MSEVGSGLEALLLLREGGRLESIEFGLRDRPLIEQALGSGYLFGWIAPSSHLLNVGLGVRLGLSHLTRMALRHSPAARDQVDQCGDEGEDDQRNHPDRLPPAAQLFVTEEIAKDLEQNHQVHDENEGPDQEPEEVPKIHVTVPPTLAIAVRTQLMSVVLKYSSNHPAARGTPITHVGVKFSLG